MSNVAALAFVTPVAERLEFGNFIPFWPSDERRAWRDAFVPFYAPHPAHPVPRVRALSIPHLPSPAGGAPPWVQRDAPWWSPPGRFYLWSRADYAQPTDWW